MAMTKQYYKNDCLILRTIDELVPKDHLVRKIDECMNFKFIEDKVKDLLIAYEDRYFNTKNGKGAAFSISLDSMIGLQIYQFLAGINLKEELSNGGE